MRHDRAKSSCFEFIGVEKECYEMERAINKTETKREENKRSGKREKKDEWKERWKAFQRTTQHLSRKISRLALTLHISLLSQISRKMYVASDTITYMHVHKIMEIGNLLFPAISSRLLI